MTTPYRTPCSTCDELRRENDSLEAKIKKASGHNRETYLLVGAMCAVGLVLGSFVYGLSTAPEPPMGCREAAEIVDINSSNRVCFPGATVDTEILPRRTDDARQPVLVRCKCLATQEHDRLVCCQCRLAFTVTRYVVTTYRARRA